MHHGDKQSDDVDRPVVIAAALGERREVPPRHTVLALINSLLQLQAAAATGRRGLDCYHSGSESYGRRLIMAVTALHQHHHGNPNIVRTLLARAVATAATGDSGCVNESTATGEYLLHIAARRGLRVVVRALLHVGAKVNATVRPYRYYTLKGVLLEGMSTLHWAASRGHSGIVEDLLAAGADKNAKVTHSGESPLHLAARCGHHATVCVLLGAGVDPIMLSRSNLSPLDLAACNNHPITVKEFLCHGIDPNRTNPLGYTALHQAAYHNAVDALEILIEAGGSLAAVAHRGFTPLHVAAFSSSTAARPAGANIATTVENSNECHKKDSRRRSAVLTLARHDGELNALDASGNTPLRLACIYMRQQAVTDLLSVGAKMNFDVPQGAQHRACFFVSPDGTARGTTKHKNNRDDLPAVSMADKIVCNPADRAWKRRGWLALFRARALEDARQRDGNSSTSNKDGWRKGRRRNSSDGGGSAGSCGDNGADDRRVKRKAPETDVGTCGRGVFAGDLSGGFWEVVKRTVTLEDDEIFSKIVCFL